MRIRGGREREGGREVCREERNVEKMSLPYENGHGRGRGREGRVWREGRTLRKWKGGGEREVEGMEAERDYCVIV